MDALNGSSAVPDEEVDAVVSEAQLLSGEQRLGRRDLMRALGAWFANVQRTCEGLEIGDDEGLEALMFSNIR